MMRTRLSFYEIKLLLEIIIQENPFRNKEKWQSVVDQASSKLRKHITVQFALKKVQALLNRGLFNASSVFSRELREVQALYDVWSGEGTLRSQVLKMVKNEPQPLPECVVGPASVSSHTTTSPEPAATSVPIPEPSTKFAPIFSPEADTQFAPISSPDHVVGPSGLRRGTPEMFLQYNTSEPHYDSKVELRKIKLEEKRLRLVERNIELKEKHRKDKLEFMERRLRLEEEDRKKRIILEEERLDLSERRLDQDSRLYAVIEEFLANYRQNKE